MPHKVILVLSFFLPSFFLLSSFVSFFLPSIPRRRLVTITNCAVAGIMAPSVWSGSFHTGRDCNHLHGYRQRICPAVELPNRSRDRGSGCSVRRWSAGRRDSGSGHRLRVGIDSSNFRYKQTCHYNNSCVVSAGKCITLLKLSRGKSYAVNM